MRVWHVYKEHRAGHTMIFSQAAAATAAPHATETERFGNRHFEKHLVNHPALALRCQSWNERAGGGLRCPTRLGFNYYFSQIRTFSYQQST